MATDDGPWFPVFHTGDHTPWFFSDIIIGPTGGVLQLALSRWKGHMEAEQRPMGWQPMGEG
jgi:hypothetical protein